MTPHEMAGPDLPGGSALCLCARGVNHPVALFDVPVAIPVTLPPVVAVPPATGTLGKVKPK